MDRLRKVKEGRGRPGRRKSRGDLASDVARFAEPADDQLAVAIEDQRDRLLERLGEAVGKRVESACLVMEDRASELKHGGVAVGSHDERPSHGLNAWEA